MSDIPRITFDLDGPHYARRARRSLARWLGAFLLVELAAMGLIHTLTGWTP